MGMHGFDPFQGDGATRVDRWLTAARLYKTRAQAQTACTGGHVRVNGQPVKPSHLVKSGDEVRAEAPRGLVVLIVRHVAEKRLSTAMARELYEDRSPPPPPKEERDFGLRERGAGRPTKADRRAVDKLKGDQG
jgi:ribosome-associated heat shock protein Hsp15